MVKFKIYGVKNFKDQAYGKAERRWLICFTSLVLGLLSCSYHTTPRLALQSCCDQDSVALTETGDEENRKTVKRS